MDHRYHVGSIKYCNVENSVVGLEQKIKIAVLGAGESGNGAALLAKHKGYEVFVSDAGVIAAAVRQELEEAAISFESGGHTFSKIAEADIIIKSPGIPEKAPVIKELRALNKEIISEIEWGFRFKGDSKIIAITGTNGKSTTTALTGHVLQQGGINALIGGNIGISFARLLATKPLADWYVLELSSFQLDDNTSFRPEVGILLNITPDHLNRYDYDFSKYIAAKFKMAAFQNDNDLLVVNADDPVITDYLNKHQIKPKIAKITMNKENLNPGEDGAFQEDEALKIRLNGDVSEVSIHDLKIKGQHNLYNSMAAGISARAAGLRKEKFKDCFSTFEGLEHRLEFVLTVRGVDFINDSKGTNLNSVWFALESMKKPVVLILGGQDKGNNYDEIKDLVKEKVHAIVCMGLDNEPILKSLSDSVAQIVETKSAKDAVHAAYALAEPGDVVLLSPGCASFDLFKNFEDRGTQFKNAVRNL